MITNWGNIAWIFKGIESFHAIYIQEATLDDWDKMITFLNEYDSLVFKLFDCENFDPYKITNQIDREFIIQSFSNPSEEDDFGDAHFDLNGLKINCYFQLKDQIELHFKTDDVNSIDDYKKVEELMVKLSTLFDKQVTLAEEGEAIFPLIKVDVTRGIIEAVDEKKYKNRYYTLKYRIEDLYLSFLLKFSPKKHRIMLDMRHENASLSKKIKDNEW